MLFQDDFCISKGLIICQASFLKRHSDICGQCSFRTTCVSTQSYMRAALSALLKQFHYFLADSEALTPDYVDVQADHELHCLHMPECLFSRDNSPLVN